MRSSTPLKTGIHLTLILLAILLASSSEARERDQEFRRGKNGRKGNENSERVNRLNIGNPHHGGNGCPNGTMSLVFAPDNLSFSILFDRFVAEVSTTQKRDMMNCSIVVPIEIPANMRMEITRVDYRGFAALPDRAQGLLHSSLNFRGRGGNGDKLNLRYRFNGPLMDNYEISTDALDNQKRDDSEMSPCGGPTELVISSRLQLVSKRGEDAQLTLDSIDGSNNAIYYVNWRACRKAGHGNDRQKHPGRDNRGF